MSRLLFIVARGRVDLFDHLHRQFADAANRVEVTYDRRLGERRERDISVAVERRVRERRTHDVGDHLPTIGWVLIRRTIES